MKIELTIKELRLIIDIMGNSTEDPGILIGIVQTPANCKKVIDTENKLREAAHFPKREYDDYKDIHHNQNQ